MGPLELSLAAAALMIGATGTFSPCGLSVVETIGPTGHTGGRRTTLAACVAFVPGALVGGVATFALLALAGEAVHGAGGEAAYLVAAAIAALAAVLEARGVRVVPQIRRQVPEHWRRVMPLPSPRPCTASCWGSASPPSFSPSASGRWRGSASRSATPPWAPWSAPASAWGGRYRSSPSRRWRAAAAGHEPTS